MLLAAAMTSGCVSMQPTMTNFSLDYNRVIADTRNRMILLNIVRSAYREPTYYTAVSQIEGSLNLQTSISGQIANLAGGSATALTPTIGGTLTNAPTFTIVPLNSEDFAKGMLQPIDPDTIRLFLSQGWRDRFLAPLVVEKIECIYDNQVVGDIANRPGRRGDDAPDNDAQAQDFAGIRFYLGKAESNAEYRLTVDSTEALKQITSGALDKFEFKFGPAPGTAKSAGAATLAAMAISADGSRQLEAHVPDGFRTTCLARFQDSLKQNPRLSQRLALTPTAAASVMVSDRVSTGDSKAAPGSGTISLNVVFRSPDAIVYYLGERLRVKLESGTQAPDADGDTLFDVDRNASGPVAISVTHRGYRWSIPAQEIERHASGLSKYPPVDRSLEVVSLLNQLISVQTSLKEFSRAPSSVRVR